MKCFASDMQWDYRLRRYIDVMVESESGKYVLHSDVQAELDALKAQNAELLAAQQWRDIESAPTTGYFKAWHGIWACEITVCFIADGTRSWLIEKTKATKWPVDAFTRWQPLPPPPEAKARGESV